MTQDPLPWFAHSISFSAAQESISEGKEGWHSTNNLESSLVFLSTELANLDTYLVYVYIYIHL